MKKRLLDKIKINIVKQYPNYSKDKIDEIMYGIEGIYMLITKTIIIFILAMILGIFKELLYLLIAFNFIRLFAFGMHANKSYICLIFSSLLFIGGAFLCKYLIFNKNILYLLYLISFIIITIFAPADTIKRPLIKKSKRIRFKVCSLIVILFYFILTLFIKNNLIINSLIIGIYIECILILPITYKAFNMPYNNYKNYGLST